MKNVLSVCKKNNNGFALAQMMVGLGLAAIVALVIGVIGKQAGFITKSSQRLTGIIELQNLNASIVRNPQTWLAQIRNNPISNDLGLCLAEQGTAPNCPVEDATLLTNDAALQNIAGTKTAASVNIVDVAGRQIAGTVANPLLIDQSGINCATNCPLQSVGYILRSGTTTNPGQVEVVVKVDNNPNYTGQRTATGADYIKFNLANEWMMPSAGSVEVWRRSRTLSQISGTDEVNGLCPSGQLLTGFSGNGSPFCVDPDMSQQCGAGKIFIGSGQSGANCMSLPTCAAGESAVLTDEGMACSKFSPCGSDSSAALVGFYGGGEPMCMDSSQVCSIGQAQVGQTINAGNVQPQCMSVSTSDCASSSQFSFYNGENFQCDKQTRLPTGSFECPVGEYVSTLNTDSEGNISGGDCSPITVASSGGVASCKNFTSPQHGGVLHVGGPSTKQYCIENGYEVASSFSWIYTSGTVSSYVGGYWHGDEQGGYSTKVACCTANVVCKLEADVVDVQKTNYSLLGFEGLQGECRLSSVTPKTGKVAADAIAVKTGNIGLVASTATSNTSPWPNQLDAIFSCPAGTTKKSCAFKDGGAGPLGLLECYCLKE